MASPGAAPNRPGCRSFASACSCQVGAALYPVLEQQRQRGRAGQLAGGLENEAVEVTLAVEGKLRGGKRRRRRQRQPALEPRAEVAVGQVLTRQRQLAPGMRGFQRLEAQPAVDQPKPLAGHARELHRRRITLPEREALYAQSRGAQVQGHGQARQHPGPFRQCERRVVGRRQDQLGRVHFERIELQPASEHGQHARIEQHAPRAELQSLLAIHDVVQYQRAGEGALGARVRQRVRRQPAQHLAEQLLATADGGQQPVQQHARGDHQQRAADADAAAPAPGR